LIIAKLLQTALVVQVQQRVCVCMCAREVTLQLRDFWCRCLACSFTLTLCIGQIRR